MISDIQLDCFLNLAKTLNFSETAKQLCLTQQAVSKNISRMEKELGVPMFERSSHGVQITTWGQQFQQINRNYMRQIAAMKEAYLSEKNKIRIAILNQPDFAPLRSLPPFKMPGTDTIANVQIEFATPATLSRYLADKQTDAVITLRRFVPYEKGLCIQSLHAVSIAFLLSEDYPGYHEGATWRDFVNAPLLMGVDHQNFFETHKSIEQDIRQFHLNPQSIIILPETTNAVEEAARGRGLLLGTTLTAQCCEEKLRCIPLDQEDEIVCAWNENFSKTYIREFACHVRTAYSELAGI